VDSSSLGWLRRIRRALSNGYLNAKCSITAIGAD
jgi:hypothetical protein